MNSDDLKKSKKRLTRKTISEITRPSTIIKATSANSSFQNSPASKNSKIEHFIRNSPKSSVCHSKKESNPNTNRGSFNFEFAVKQYFQQTDTYIGKKLENRYKILEKLGEGAFSKVYKALDTETQENVALKIANKDFRAKRSAQNEVKILSKYKGSDLIAQIKDDFLYEGCKCIVQELYNTNLYSVLSKTGYEGLPIRVIKQIATQLISALALFSLDNLCHADLKPENILIPSTQTMAIKICDFGCGFYGKLISPGYIQSRFYRAPEVLLNANCDSSIDMWSVGCILSELYTGDPLFPGRNTQDQLQKIIFLVGQPPEDLLVNCPEDLKRVCETCQKCRSLQGEISSPLFVDFLLMCLRYRDRITPQDALLHPWLAG